MWTIDLEERIVDEVLHKTLSDWNILAFLPLTYKNIFSREY